MRKVVELPLAVYFDLVMPKRRIMEIYLNIAEWGPDIYGIEAAAQHHFGRSAKNLTRRQAALLAVTLPNPIARNPAKPGPGLRRLAIADRAPRRPGRATMSAAWNSRPVPAAKKSRRHWSKRHCACMDTPLSKTIGP